MATPRTAWKGFLPPAAITVLMGTVWGLPLGDQSAGLKSELGVVALVSIFGFFLTRTIIPRVCHRFPPCLQGRDLGKKGTPQFDRIIPEGVGLVSGGVTLICLICVSVLVQEGQLLAEPLRLVEYFAGVLSICLGLLLGFTDDVLDIPHRYKLVLPLIASLPLVVSYHGVTDVVVPTQLRQLFVTEQSPDGYSLTSLGKVLNTLAPVDIASGGAILQLGFFYQIYMLLLSVFCTNSINILAGINGLEAGQSLIIGISIIVMNLMELSQPADPVAFTGNDFQHFLSVSSESQAGTCPCLCSLTISSRSPLFLLN